MGIVRRGNPHFLAILAFFLANFSKIACKIFAFFVILQRE